MEQKSNIPTVTAQMLIRQPAHTVFEAFIDPEITRHFWFTKGSGMLKKDQHITWEWDMYGVSIAVFVEEIIADRFIQIQWDEPSTMVQFEFREIAGLGTYVEITNTGFQQQNAELWEAINNNTGGFTTVLDGAKAYLEHGIELNLIADKFPSQATSH
ncbi:SRPBCC family protein [Dyadobacter sp. LJ53]|uniref:SRPBCC family protein n=1 Tax=Dyadobacter chenwenxiniae TaxID=2906456 RepID=UPI001F3A7058|nr:SRPBCC family protein [Dyadobacter chenwenxiniae]MCF0049097.1 SRPBCC family protein [Dyadobacter chenwenxiniae]